MTNRFHLYFDDTGSRDPDKSAFSNEGERKDGMDCFGLGGILVNEVDIPEILTVHKAFCEEHDIDYPLHSWAIRGGRGNFGWLKTPEKAGIFLSALEEMILSLPMTVVVCVVHRPGYIARYSEQYKERLWYMCKTSFSILIERSTKFVREHDGKMEVYFEETGQKEDADIIAYMKELKESGMPFSGNTSGEYEPLGPDEFKETVLGRPQRRTKKTPMIQLADLVLYPVAKSGYVPDYPPFIKLRKAGKLIDCHLGEDDIPMLGNKFSCFDE